MSQPETRLFVALPTTDGVMAAQFMAGMIDLMMSPPTPHIMIQQIVDSRTPYARNSAATDFLNTDYTHLLFIDADILFKAKHVKKLLSHDVDIVAGFYPKKKEGKVIEWACNSLPGKLEANESGLMEVRRMATGFMLIKRVVFIKMREKLGDKIHYLEEHTDNWMWDFFPMGVVDHRYLSEDWGFCDRAREMGFKVYGDLNVKLSHVGVAVYPLQSQIAASNKSAEKAEKLA